MAEKVAQHAHCQMCGKAIPVSETLCSEECKQRFRAMVKKRKMYMYIMYFAIFLILLVYVFVYFGAS